MLINFYGVKILTDPIFAERVWRFLGFTTAGPEALLCTGAAAEIAEVGPVPCRTRTWITLI